jgi:putative PIN family toxin of toxin-antitoxin system
VQKRNSAELRVVLDTNILISYLWGSRTSESILQALREGLFRSIVSATTLAELARVGRSGKFSKRFGPEAFGDFLAAYRHVSLLVDPKCRISVCPDQSDNAFLECAFESGADYLVTGDEHLLSIASFGTTMIVTPRVFTEMVL